MAVAEKFTADKCRQSRPEGAADGTGTANPLVFVRACPGFISPRQTI